MESYRTDSFGLSITTNDPTVEFLEGSGTGSLCNFSVALPQLPISRDETWNVSLSSLTIALAGEANEDNIVPLAVRLSLCDSDRFGVTADRDILYIISPALLPPAPITVNALAYLAPRDAASAQWIRVSDDAADERRVTVRITYMYPGNIKDGSTYAGGTRSARRATILNLAFQRTGMKR